MRARCASTCRRSAPISMERRRRSAQTGPSASMNSGPSSQQIRCARAGADRPPRSARSSRQVRTEVRVRLASSSAVLTGQSCLETRAISRASGRFLPNRRKKASLPGFAFFVAAMLAEAMNATPMVSEKRKAPATRSAVKRSDCRRELGGGTIAQGGAYTLLRNWLRGRDSNPRPSAYETDALPLRHPRILTSFARDPSPRAPRSRAGCAKSPRAESLPGSLSCPASCRGLADSWRLENVGA